MPKFLSDKLDPATLDSLADFICGDDADRFPEYRSSSYLTRFFSNIEINAIHDGSTRKWWVLEVLKKLSLDDIERVILRLVDIREYKADKNKLEMARKAMSDILFMENLDVSFRGRDPILTKIEDSSDILKNDKQHLSGEDFLKKDFEENDIIKLDLDASLTDILKERINESRKCLNNGAYLCSIIMAGSVLEGILLSVAAKNPKLFNQSRSAPKKDRKILQFPYWTLSSFIDVSYEIGFLGLDVRKFSHAMRDFRNYIHPYEQISANFRPDEHTAKMCLQALNAAISDLIKKDMSI